MRSCVCGLILALALFSCGPKQEEANQYKKNGFYPQDFTSPVALIVRERNGAPLAMGSADLRDKEQGLFVTAKHVIGDNSDGSCKIFFNGRVYDGVLKTVPEVVDLAIVGIKGSFNWQDFPEPYPLAAEVRKGEKVFVQGIHIHPSQFQTGKKVVPILEKYYGMIGGGGEFVFDELEGKVVKLERQIQNSNIQDGSKVLAEVANLYIRLETKEEHRLSATRGFAGLSGGPTINERGELVGVNSVEDQSYLEISQEGLTYYPWNSLNLVPVGEVRKLLSQVASIR